MSKTAQRYFITVEASERLPGIDGKYIVIDASGRVGDLWYAKDSPTHWHYLDMSGNGKTENVVFDAEYIIEWLEEIPTPIQYMPYREDVGKYYKDEEQLNSEQSVQGSDTTDDDSSTEVGTQKS